MSAGSGHTCPGTAKHVSAHSALPFQQLSFHIVSEKDQSDPSSCFMVMSCVCVCAVLGLELRAYTFSHSTNPFL
jgi:hypothetical protein